MKKVKDINAKEGPFDDRLDLVIERNRKWLGKENKNPLGEFMKKLICDNLTEEEFETAEQIAKKFNESRKSVEHKFCYRVWVKSFYEGENADRVEEEFGMYERVFTEKSDMNEYIEKVKTDLEVLGHHPFENAYKFYDCAVMDSTIVFNWNNVRFW